MQKHDDAMPSSFSGLSKNARYQKQHRDDLIKIVNHPSFKREALKVQREKKSAITANLLEIFTTRNMTFCGIFVCDDVKFVIR
jgi:predicted NAD/FAD-binding protein